MELESNEAVEHLLNSKGWLKTRKTIQHAEQFILTDGTCVLRYSTGRVVVQGKATPLKEQVEELFKVAPSAPSLAPTGENRANPAALMPSPRRVFIVYGHDAEAREQLELLLRRLRLEPIVLQNITTGGDTIIEKLETLTAADFACVLLTPDDEGHAHGASTAMKPRARQNVVLELGMVLAHLGRKRVAVLVKGRDLERPSDIEGLIYLPFTARVEETKNQLAANLQNAGFTIQVADLI